MVASAEPPPDHQKHHRNHQNHLRGLAPLAPDLLSKKHLIFGQGLEFLEFGQRNRSKKQQNRRKAEEHISKHEEHHRFFNKKFRDRDPYFLLRIAYYTFLVYH